ncbi:hypothetical protein [Roseovarius arcticus]|uniref:hypothetical protein n=1 Tax=Roseovarius arcticus TaxID=2547404 RepID=UPI001110E359|nr:hypothetical protein [Roseovarius arcticus]
MDFDQDRKSHKEGHSPFTVGVMKMEVEGRDAKLFHDVVARSVIKLEAALAHVPRLSTKSLAFAGPHLTPRAGKYAPLDFLEVGLAEKLERDLPFLLIVTEVDLSSSSLAYTLALPSRLTNIAIISTRRLDPGFWGYAPDPEKAATRLATLMLHSFGHLVALKHERDPANVMYPLEGVEDLDHMRQLTKAQQERIAHMLPQEANERSTRDGKLVFACRILIQDAGAITRAVMRANPFRLLTRMPTMLAAALSVIIVLLFSAETWDVAHAVTVSQIVLFSIISLAAAVFVLYRAFAFNTLLSRDRRITESSVVTIAVTFLSLLLTLLVMFMFFGGLMYFGILTVFPQQLMESWPGAGEATTALDHLKLSLFLAAMGVLAGSLGGRSDSRDLVRGVLFILEDT